MTETPSDDAADQVVVAFAVEISVQPPGESVDFDAVAYGGEIVRDAISGWGVAIVRIVHLANPDEVFAG
jgi:hypothetical protein